MVVYTGGTFDLLHEGHLELLSFCRRMAGTDGRVIVGLNRDAFVERYKGRLPVQPYAKRQSMLETTDVDEVVPNIGDEDSRPSIDAARPDVVLIGSDWHDNRYLQQLGLDFDWLHERGIVLAYAPRPSGGPSTSRARGC